jgi:hypothetical protein
VLEIGGLELFDTAIENCVIRVKGCLKMKNQLTGLSPCPTCRPCIWKVS